MSADSYDDFDYQPASEYTSGRASQALLGRRHRPAKRRSTGLKVSDYLRDQAHAYIRGEKGLDEVGELVRKRYAGADANGESKPTW